MYYIILSIYNKHSVIILVVFNDALYLIDVLYIRTSIYTIYI